jgi:Holliday junction resolvasome RuvABC endonuclease subunit
MSRYLGLDPATQSGWSFFEDDRLLEKGSIIIPGAMELPQKLHYFHLELKNLFTRLQPERIFIEDVILGISGARTLAFLGRLSGVAINASFEIVQERVKVYDPTYWKSHSFEGLGGMAKKWQIQIAVIKHHNLPITGNFDVLDKVLTEKADLENNLRAEWDILRKKQQSIILQINRKRDPVSRDDKIVLTKELNKIIESISNAKKTLKEKEKEYDKKFSKISIDLAAQTGITDNIADSCGIARCGWLETKDE